MSLFVNIKPVPSRLLDDLLAQMEGNNERLIARQGDKGGPTRPRPQRTVFNADASTYRRPEPAASPRAAKSRMAFGWVQWYATRRGTNGAARTIMQVFSGDRSYSYELDITDVELDYVSRTRDDNAFWIANESLNVFPIDEHRFLLVLHWLAAEPDDYIGEAPENGWGIQRPYEQQIWCLLVGGRTVKRVENVPEAFKRRLLGVWTNPDHWFRDSQYYTSFEFIPNLGYFNLPTAPGFAYGVTDQMQRVYWDSNWTVDIGISSTANQLGSLANLRNAGYDPMLMCPGSPAIYGLLDQSFPGDDFSEDLLGELGDGDVGRIGDPELYRWYWRQWTDEFPGGNITFEDQASYIGPTGLTWDLLRESIPAARSVDILSVDYLNPGIGERHAEYSQDGTRYPGWFYNMLPGTTMTYRRYIGSKPTGNVLESRVAMTQENCLPTAERGEAMWGPPVEYPYQMEASAPVVGPDGGWTVALFVQTVDWGALSGRISRAYFSNGAVFHTIIPESDLEDVPYSQMPTFFGVFSGAVLVQFPTGGEDGSLTLYQEDIVELPSVVVMYAYMSNGAIAMCPNLGTSDQIYRLLSDGDIGYCEILQDGTSPSAARPAIPPLPIVVSDWGRKAQNYLWLRRHGFTKEDLSLPVESPPDP